MNISAMGMGAIYAACLFLICVIIVHGVKLALLGYRTLGRKLPPDPPPKPKPKPTPPEPVYYIVERKKKRAKAEYTEPRRIQFK